MEAQGLYTRLTEILQQNKPQNSSDTMPEELKEAFTCFVKSHSKASIPFPPLEPFISAAFEQGFWLGHDYALEYGQLRGD